MTLEQLARQGRRTASMTTAATISSKMSQIRKENIKQAFCDFDNVRYRYEYTDTIEGVSYYDDSGACSNEASWFSFDNLHQDVVWITYADNRKCNELLPQVKKYVKSIICIGNDNEIFHKVYDDMIGNRIFHCNSISEAVKLAHSITKPGDNVLFSPACKVDDNYISYTERGDYFKQCVQSLK